MNNRCLLVYLMTVMAVHGIRLIGEDCYADCPARYDPVCGSDGKTYNNECELNRLAECREQTDIRKVKDRPCDVGTIVLLDSFEWKIDAPRVRLDVKSALTLDVAMDIAKGSDNLSGKNLWRVGIFGSQWPDGYGVKLGYQEQILSAKQASKRVKKSKVLKLKKLRARYDLSKIGCDAYAYFCVEFARNPMASVDFELRAGVQVDSIVACKEFDCQRPNFNVSRNDLPPTCVIPCPLPEILGGAVCGNNGVQYESICELTKAKRCEGVSVDIDYPGECITEVIVSSIYWTATAQQREDNHRLSLLAVELFLFNDNSGVNIQGTDLWQVSLFGSSHINGSGLRHEVLEQVLDRELSATPLIGGFPFSLTFTAEYNTYAVGCGDVPYFCLQIKRNANASVNFIIRKASRERTIITCRQVPCIPAPDPNKLRLLFRHVSWNVVADRFRFDAPSDISLNISIEVQENSEAIAGGRNMWRIGMYGSRSSTGVEDEKLNFIPQVLSESDSLFSPDVVPGRTLVFPLISTQFDISAIGCTEYTHLCVTVGKDPDSEPDFAIANNENKRKVVSCRQVQCISREQLPPPLTTALLSYLTWNLTIQSLRDDGAYDVIIAVNVVPSIDTDTIEGTGLWRVGVFLSNATSGIMARSQYQPDILTEEHKAISLIRGQNLLFKNLEAVLNVQGVGCPGSSLQYACMEFARGESPEPTFNLPLGASNAAHSCRRLFCHQTSSAK